MAPMRARKMRLHQAPAADRQWLSTVLDRISRGFGSRVDLQPDGMLTLRLAPDQRSPAAQPTTPTMRSTSTRAKGWSWYCG